jgi:hypothetical protein
MLTKEQWKEWYDSRVQFDLDTTSTNPDEPKTYLEIFAEIFNLTTYSSNMDRYFGFKILEVLNAMATGHVFDYQAQSEQHNKDYLMVCNFGAVAPLLNWGTSIRGAWIDTPQDGWVLEEYLGNYSPPQGLQPVLRSRDEAYDFIKNSVEIIKEQEASFAAKAASDQDPAVPTTDQELFAEYSRRLTVAVNGISEALAVMFKDITDTLTDDQLEHEITKLVDRELPQYFTEWGDAKESHTLANHSTVGLRAWTLTIQAYNQHGTIAIQ